MRFSKDNVIHLFFAIIFGLFISGQLSAAEDDFLNAIEAESGKVGVWHERVEDKADVEVKPPALDDIDSLEASALEPVNVSERELFEKTLDEKYHGSYIFYKKLPERSQEEIVQEYNRGTPYVKLRKKIIDRFMYR